MMKKIAIIFGLLALVACNKIPNEEPDEEGVASYKTAFRQEDYTKGKLAEANFHLYSFIKQELEIEGRICNGNFTDLSPKASAIKTLWIQAYKVVRDCAIALYYIPISSPANSDYYICQFSAIRGLITCQMASLWGSVPFYTLPQEDYTQAVDVYNSTKLFSSAVSDFSKAIKINGTIPEGYLNRAAILTLHSIVELSRNNKEAAKELLNKAKQQFDGGETACSLLNTDPLSTFVIPEPIELITKTTVQLLLEEALGQTEQLNEKWETLGTSFGHWQMLTRTNQAQKITGCSDYQLLLPIPADVVENNDVSQNPGY